MDASISLGFIGLGNIGRHFAHNLAGAWQLTVFDKAGTRTRAPDESLAAESAAEVFGASDITFLSLPSGPVVLQVLNEVVSVSRTPEIVVDLSTIGLHGAREAAALLQRHGIDYLECPVSGGIAAAKTGTVSLMCAGSYDSYKRCSPMFEIISKNAFYLGEQPGLGQAMKLANNFLAATALAATSEAVCFGLSAGLDMEAMLEVLNASSGRNGATEDKFPQEVVTERFDSGFVNELMSKDIKLFREAAAEVDRAGPMGILVDKIWKDFAAQSPEQDFTKIYLHTKKLLDKI